jgi:hypothetical protein
MKRLLTLLIFCFSFFVSHGETKFKFFKENFRDTTVKTNLPFGSPILIDHKFPSHWDYDPDQDDGPHEAAFYKLVLFYNHLNKLKPAFILKPSVIKKIPIGDDSLIIEDKGKFFNKVAYRLPNFGPYKCYYQYDIQNPNTLKSKDLKSYTEIGNLILFDQKTKQANILKIYTSYAGQDFLAEHHRFFYISKDKNISIYESRMGEMDGNMKKMQIITVTSEGKIIVKNLK